MVIDNVVYTFCISRGLLIIYNLIFIMIYFLVYTSLALMLPDVNFKTLQMMLTYTKNAAL